MLQPRNYQLKAVNDIRSSFEAGNKQVLLLLPTGSGKTVIVAFIAKKAVELGKKVLFIANRQELIYQALRTLASFDLVCGVIMAGVPPKLDAQVQIASMQTYVRRMNLEELRNHWWHDADLIIVDEAHGSISPSFQKILSNYGDKFVLGLTATPCRADGRDLGEYYQDIVSTISTQQLIDKNYLVPPRYFAASTPDLSGIKTVRGDYEKKVLGERVNTPKLVGDIYENWSMICPDRPTIIFATNVPHSISIKNTFKSHRVSIAHIDARTPKGERDEALEALRAGVLQVISNVGILTEGFDFPDAACVALARPTKSLGLYIQMGGRGLRPSPGKNDCIILDFAGCAEEHGLLEWDREWSLDGKKKAWSEPRRKEKEGGLSKCPACHAVFTGQKSCPDCGSELKPFGRKVETADAELKELSWKATVAEKRIYLGMLKKWVFEKGYSPRMINAKYRNRFGVWPHSSIVDVAPITPDAAFKNRMRHEQIRWAKRRAV